MYEAMRSVLKDPELAAKLSQEAIKVRDEFPLWKIAKRLVRSFMSCKEGNH